MTDSPFALRPIGDDVPPEAAQLAERLREVFSSLNLTMRRYATRTHRNPGAVSRYLNGTRVPPWDFVTELLTEVARTRGTPIKTEVVDHLRRNHRRALQASSKNRHEVQRLQDQLEEADLRVRESEVRQQVLMEGLQLREARIAQLEVKQAEITARWHEEKDELGQHLTAINLRHESTTDELERLKLEVAQLRQDLALAREATQQAEEKCSELEEKLVEAEERAQAGEEAREASALERARRMAEEAKAVADELRRKLEAYESITPSNAAGENSGQMTYEGFRERGERRRQERFSKLTSRPVEEIVHDFLRASVSGNASRGRDLRDAVAEVAPLADAELICWELVEKGYASLAQNVAARIATARSVEEVSDFVKRVGATNVSREASELVNETLTRFAWLRRAEDIPLFTQRLRDENWEAWALTVEDECAIRRNPQDLVKLLRILDEKTQTDILDAVAGSRSVTDIPALFMSMEQQGETELIPLLLELLETHREDKVKGVLDAWELAKQ
ncbi:hypothetical protein [Streptomyces cellostaticus]|uniref:hypothetical protein n=1 Tax=Streptomyces TaxID=1883 RepID=UPI002025EA2D|nr:hypothetical protein [Streptomyces cellostaticus]